ncbi:type III-B CRISPR module RAMP protein Cmr4 [Psychrobacter arenosus]|uniref:type III-B CRISPR module RAMP protein Cmr4 n=1 Tax=Psychrobacter arenosus TaxID=256326 RepID=UPI0019181FE7|nr:type III-B CRISPR module RAMP protein Cmr4 [Psychrobacter arenosus]
MTSHSFIMSMVAQTSIHAGAGQALSVIDLPIQREGHTQHPVIFGSSLKGALRYRARQTLLDSKNRQDEEKDNTQEKIFAVFGPDTTGAESNAHAGAIMVSDARLLLLPVRSLNGYFKWVTCPALIRRYIRDCQRAGLNTNGLELTRFDLDLDGVILPDSKLTTLFLEEFALKVQRDEALQSIIKHIANTTNIDEVILNTQFALVNDDMFSYLSQNCTPVNAHIALDENKTVKKGALWYEETLPPETVMYSLIACTDSRRTTKESLNAQAVADILTEQVIPPDNRYLQVGGNETVGMGWFAINFISQ